MTEKEIIKAIQDNDIKVKASTDGKFAEIRWFDNESQTWKKANTFIRDVIQGADSFADLQNDTNVAGNNGQEVINNLDQKDKDQDIIIEEVRVKTNENSTKLDEIYLQLVED